MKNRRVALAPILGGCLLLLLVAAYLALPSVQSSVNHALEVLASGERARIEDWLARFGAWGPVIIIVAMTVQMFLVVIPSWGLMIVAVLAFGPVLGALLSLVAVLVAGIVGFYLGRSVGRSLLRRWLGDRTLDRARRETDRYGAWAVLIARLNPLLSNDAISIAAGAFDLSLKRFLGATIAGVAPLAALIGYFGREAGSLEKGLIAIGTGALVLLAGKITYDRRRHGSDPR